MSEILSSPYQLSEHRENSFYEPCTVTEELSDLYHMNGFHWHRHYEILVIRQGSYTVVNNKKTITAAAPAIVINRPMTIHSMNAHPDSDYIRRVIRIRRDIVNRITPEVVDSERFFAANLIYAIPDEAEWNEIDQYILLLASQIHDETNTAILIAGFIRRILQIAQSGRGEIVNCHYSYIHSVINHIADHMSESCSIESVLQKFGVKRTKFQSDFKRETGMPYHKYLVNLRMVRAQDLLLAGKSVQDTSLEVGYSGESHFIKEFQKYYGVTPGGFLKQHPVI